jgi:hypothetical protein
VSFAFNDPWLLLGEGPVPWVSVTSASLLRNSDSAVPTGMHELGPPPAIGSFEYNSDLETEIELYLLSSIF